MEFSDVAIRNCQDVRFVCTAVLYSGQGGLNASLRVRMVRLFSVPVVLVTIC